LRFKAIEGNISENNYLTMRNVEKNSENQIAAVEDKVVDSGRINLRKSYKSESSSDLEEDFDEKLD
jgi:hypothetical protein